jgi:hypothetical protein
LSKEAGLDRWSVPAWLFGEEDNVNPTPTSNEEEEVIIHSPTSVSRNVQDGQMYSVSSLSGNAEYHLPITSSLVCDHPSFSSQIPLPPVEGADWYLGGAPSAVMMGIPGGWNQQQDAMKSLGKEIKQIGDQAPLPGQQDEWESGIYLTRTLARSMQQQQQGPQSQGKPQAQAPWATPVPVPVAMPMMPAGKGGWRPPHGRGKGGKGLNMMLVQPFPGQPVQVHQGYPQVQGCDLGQWSYGWKGGAGIGKGYAPVSLPLPAMAFSGDTDVVAPPPASFSDAEDSASETSSDSDGFSDSASAFSDSEELPVVEICMVTQECVSEDMITEEETKSLIAPPLPTPIPLEPLDTQP